MQMSHEHGRSPDGNLHQLIGDEIKNVLGKIGVTDLAISSNSFKTQCDDLCSVYTSTYGDYEIRMIFSAERSLLHHIAEAMLNQPVDDPEDVIDCAKEFFNVVCGHVVSSIFKGTKYSARFDCPHFREGLCEQIHNNNDAMQMYFFFSTNNAGAVFMHDPLTNLQM